MIKVIDQADRQVSIPQNVKRIVSCVPSLTELLFDLGAGDRVVGRTKFCIHPSPAIYNIPVVGGTKDLKIDTIKSLNPDLIIGNKEENVKAQIHELSQNIPVWISDVSDFDDAIEMISLLSRILKSKDIGDKLTTELLNRKSSWADSFPKEKSSVLYLIWQKPFMAAGGDTFIHSMLDIFGLKNCMADRNRYPEISLELIKKMNPDYIFLSSEPYPFGQQHLSFFSALCPKSKILLVDGELFSWYGSRIKKSFLYFEDLKRLM